MITVKDAILSLVSNCAFSLKDEKIINWISEHQQPTETEINAELIRLQTEYDSKEYQRLRAAEYPPLADQLDMQYHDALNGTTTWQDAVNAVKAKYPKPEN
jgi:hypothetical protein